jgi:hypothetical protein
MCNKEGQPFYTRHCLALLPYRAFLRTVNSVQSYDFLLPSLRAVMVSPSRMETTRPVNLAKAVDELSRSSIMQTVRRLINEM